MSVLVDANVLSEGTKPRPVLAVIDWLAASVEEVVVNPIIVGELKYGILTMPLGRKRDRYIAWFNSGIECLPVLPIESSTAHVWAELNARLQRMGRSMPLKDSLIAATALQHNLVVATRNTTDFHYAGVTTFNPFVD